MPRDTGSSELNYGYLPTIGGTLKKTNSVKEISEVARNKITLARCKALGQAINPGIY